MRRHLSAISQAVSMGQSVSDGLEHTGQYFPRMFRELTLVGEQTGKSAEVFRRLADHYDHQVQMRRAFLSAITWPMLQLIAAVCVIGLLILVMGMLPREVDILGFGLVGERGLVIYLCFVGMVVAVVWFVYQAARRGVMWTRPLQRLVMVVPGIGKCLQSMALSRLTWSLHLTLDTGMDLKRAIKLSLNSTQNARYTDHADAIALEAVRGREIHEAMADAGVFPQEFLDSLEVAEHSGRLPETMAILSDQYQDQARRAMATLSVLGGFAVWGIIAIIIISLIFRIAFFYIDMINDATRM
jgi:type IV pilus assembly protein PilC